ncbi:EF-hand domain-containing family member B [Camponotus floridanus]|uniref:EF-hand domain-containing family member B n=1 Tax=Camponotus floridanus TaxID=104421 RepID=UPI00059C17ED|nr:EF-hand domain-containing family member B [Camponotus floridanus]
MKQIAEIEENAMKVREDITRSWYRKSHNRYEPSEQITRNYKKPFDKSDRFGKSTKSQKLESHIRRIFTWINNEPITLVDHRQADFTKRTRSFVGRIKDPKTSHLYADIVHGKKSVKDKFDASDSLRDTDLNEQTLFWWQCLRDLSNFRKKLKKRVPEVPFLDIEDELSHLDQNYGGVLPENEVFSIFEKFHISPNKEFLSPLMDTLLLRKDGNINYRKLLNLLNWRCNLPVLPKMKQASLANSDYVSTYGDSIGNVQTIDSAKNIIEIRAAGLPSTRSDFSMTMLPRAGIYPDKENLGDQTSVHCLISPSIFTRYGLTHIDLFKIRDKEEMREIFENVGFEFPENSFDAFWQEGQRKDCSDGVCVETFRKLLTASDFVTKKTICE